MPELALRLTVAEINHILEALGQKPYQDVYQLINNIQQQAERQLQEKNQGVNHEQQ